MAPIMICGAIIGTVEAHTTFLKSAGQCDNPTPNAYYPSEAVGFQLVAFGSGVTVKFTSTKAECDPQDYLEEHTLGNQTTWPDMDTQTTTAQGTVVGKEV